MLLENGLCYVTPNPCLNKPYVFSTDGSCTALCGTGYYLDVLMCRPCNVGCATCTDANACGTCGNGYTFNATSGTCYCDYTAGNHIYLEFCLFNCPVAYYKNSTTKRCEKCGFGCLVCTSESVCTSCYSPYVVNAVTNICDCTGGNKLLLTGECYTPPDLIPECTNKPYVYTTTGQCSATCSTSGFYLDNIYCRPCFTGCATCSNGDACSVCGNGFTLNLTSGVCYCASGKFLNLAGTTCNFFCTEA